MNIDIYDDPWYEILKDIPDEFRQALVEYVCNTFEEEDIEDELTDLVDCLRHPFERFIDRMENPKD